jgi:DNA polymerase III psi subunit
VGILARTTPSISMKVKTERGCTRMRMERVAMLAQASEVNGWRNGSSRLEPPGLW